MPTVGENIKRIRKEKGITQNELVQKCNILYQTLGKYERGLLNPKLETIKKLANALGVTTAELIEEDLELEEFKERRRAFATQWNREFRHKKILFLMDQLNEEGQEKAIENVEILTKVEEYRKKENDQ